MIILNCLFFSFFIFFCLYVMHIVNPWYHVDNNSQNNWETFISKKTTASIQEVLLNNSEELPHLEKERKDQAITWLKHQHMDTKNNRKLIEQVQFTENAVIIGGISFSRELLKPQNRERSESNKEGISKSSDVLGVWKQGDEYYFSRSAYVEECQEQGKMPVTKEDIQQALEKLPKKTKVDQWYDWGALLAILLWLEGKGYVSEKDLREEDGCWFFGTATGDEKFRRVYEASFWKGGLHNNKNSNVGFQALFLTKESEQRSLPLPTFSDIASLK